MNTKEFAICLFEIEVNAHIAHWQAKNTAMHLHLGELYEGIVELRDDYIETYSGVYDVPKGFPKSIEIFEGKDMSIYLKSEVKKIREYRKTIVEPELQQMIDNVVEFLNKILYKLVKLPT